jgi:hypothetical protein
LGARHCEERKRRSNPESTACNLDCFAVARNDALTQCRYHLAGFGHCGDVLHGVCTEARCQSAFMVEQQSSGTIRSKGEWAPSLYSALTLARAHATANRCPRTLSRGARRNHSRTLIVVPEFFESYRGEAGWRNRLLLAASRLATAVLPGAAARWSISNGYPGAEGRTLRNRNEAFRSSKAKRNIGRKMQREQCVAA